MRPHKGEVFGGVRPDSNRQRPPEGKQEATSAAKAPDALEQHQRAQGE